jgi:ElaB/YqjD/DUF883 family membrane-anchored ribosome-binding protein
MSKELIKEAANNGYKSHSDMSAIKQDIENLKQDTASLIRHSKEEGYEQLSHAEKKAKKALKEAKSATQDQYKEVEAFVRTNPGQSIALAFGAGILASFLLGRGR